MTFHLALIPLGKVRIQLFSLQGRLGSSLLVRQLVLEKENSEFKPVKLRLKIDLVSYPARGLVNRISSIFLVIMLLLLVLLLLIFALN